MAIIIGNGAFRIWRGKDKESGRSNNVGIRIAEQKFPLGVDLEDTINTLEADIELLIKNRFSWCQ